MSKINCIMETPELQIIMDEQLQLILSNLLKQLNLEEQLDACIKNNNHLEAAKIDKDIEQIQQDIVTIEENIIQIIKEYRE